MLSVAAGLIVLATVLDIRLDPTGKKLQQKIVSDFLGPKAAEKS